MITFKQYLTEARMAPLYHGTHYDGAVGIARSNKFNASTEHRIGDKLVAGVSFSRDLQIALSFGPVVFVMHQDKLTQNYRIKPVQWWKSRDTITQWMVGARSRKHISLRGTQIDHGVTESEEFVEGEIKNAKKYIKEILIRDSLSHTLYDKVQSLYSGIPIRVVNLRHSH